MLKSLAITSVIYWLTNVRYWENFTAHCIELILGLRPADERRRYFVTTTLIG